MKDPKRTPAGSDQEPAAAHEDVRLVPAPTDYQFPTRKARRHAELTGMIPIIVPKDSAPKAPVVAEAESTGRKTNAQETAAQETVTSSSQEQVEPAAAGDAQASNDGNSESSIASNGTASNRADKSDSVIQPEAGDPGTANPAATKVAVPKTSVSKVPISKVSVPDVIDDDTQEGQAEATAPDEIAPTLAATSPEPVSALQVTGIPLIPVPGSPIAGMPAGATALKAPRTPKAGRDLPAAITVGIILLVLVIGSLLFYPVAFVVLATAFACAGVWEVTRAVAGKGIKAPLTPVMVGALSMPAAAYFAGSEGLLFALVASAGATVLWRSLDAEPGAIRSILAGIFSLMWIPFLLSFVFLMMRADQGATLGLTLELSEINPGVVQVIIMLLLVVANDTFGYLVGVLFGKHPMAPKISPKKSWEGFAGSLGGATLVAIPATVFLLDQDWWVGLALAIGMVFAGTGGDFAESMVKRELGVKDMSNLLPGHGGVMDRLDSILFAAPVAYAIFTVLGRF
ncbi:phosphatidate cytidylyltransferase [Arthrobacter sp. Sr24]